MSVHVSSPLDREQRKAFRTYARIDEIWVREPPEPEPRAVGREGGRPAFTLADWQQRRATAVALYEDAAAALEAVRADGSRGDIDAARRHVRAMSLRVQRANVGLAALLDRQAEESK